MVVQQISLMDTASDFEEDQDACKLWLYFDFYILKVKVSQFGPKKCPNGPGIKIIRWNMILTFFIIYIPSGDQPMRWLFLQEYAW